MVEFNFIKPKENKGSVKLTVQKTGKLGFSKNAIDLLDLQNNRYCKFATVVNEDGLYMLISNEKDDYTFDISKAGDYFYIKAKSFLTDLNVDYENKDITVIYDISNMDEQNNMYKLKKRVINKRK